MFNVSKDNFYEIFKIKSNWGKIMVYSKDLKSKANEAKKRLGSGYFQRQPIENSENCFSKQDYHSNGIDYIDEEKMYELVRDILDSENVVINPIGCLMDKAKFDSMDSVNKQRYVFKLSEIYVKLKARYMEEQSISNDN